MPASVLRWGGGNRSFISGGGLAFVALFLILIYQVLLPFLLIIWTSLKTAHPGDPGFVQLSFTPMPLWEVAVKPEGAPIAPSVAMLETAEVVAAEKA